MSLLDPEQIEELRERIEAHPDWVDHRSMSRALLRHIKSQDEEIAGLMARIDELEAETRKRQMDAFYEGQGAVDVIDYGDSIEYGRNPYDDGPKPYFDAPAD